MLHAYAIYYYDSDLLDYALSRLPVLIIHHHTVTQYQLGGDFA
jgi:hypothetical protein